MRIILAGLTAALLLGAASCASMEPEPCTAEWVTWKKERVFDAYRKEHRREIDTLRETAQSLSGEGRDMSIAAAARLAPVALSLVADFMDAAVPEIQSAVSQCGAPPQAAQLFADLLRSEGVDEDTVRTVERLGFMLETRE
jgi:hypothetical protein